LFKISLKNPSAATASENNSELKLLANIGSRKHAVSFGSPFSSPAVAAEGRLKATSPIPPRKSNRPANGRHLEVIEN
jgi:hypothetical protein